MLSDFFQNLGHIYTHIHHLYCCKWNVWDMLPNQARTHQCLGISHKPTNDCCNRDRKIITFFFTEIWKFCGRGWIKMSKDKICWESSSVGYPGGIEGDQPHQTRLGGELSFAKFKTHWTLNQSLNHKFVKLLKRKINTGKDGPNPPRWPKLGLVQFRK